MFALFRDSDNKKRIAKGPCFSDWATETTIIDISNTYAFPTTTSKK